MLRWPGVNCTLRASFGITNCLCMRVLAYRMTYRGVLSRQKRWNKGGHRDWKFLFRFLLSSTFIFLFFLSHLVTWGEMDRNWQHTCCCWQPSHCSCSLDVKGREKRWKKPSCSLNITHVKIICLLQLKPTPYSVENISPSPLQFRKQERCFFVSPSPSPRLHKENVGWYHFYCSAGVGFRPRISILNV